MKTLLSALVAALALGFGASTLAAAEHGARDPAQAAVRELDQARKWQTDEPLREGMENIRAALLAQSHIFHGGDDSRTDYGALAAQVTGELALITQNSRLEPLADADLSQLIGRMIAGAEAMQGKAQGVAPLDGAVRVAEALGDYVRLFDHPGW